MKYVKIRAFFGFLNKIKKGAEKSHFSTLLRLFKRFFCRPFLLYFSAENALKKRWNKWSFGAKNAFKKRRNERSFSTFFYFFGAENDFKKRWNKRPFGAENDFKKRRNMRSFGDLFRRRKCFKKRRNKRSYCQAAKLLLQAAQF